MIDPELRVLVVPENFVPHPADYNNADIVLVDAVGHQGGRQMLVLKARADVQLIDARTSPRGVSLFDTSEPTDTASTDGRDTDEGDLYRGREALARASEAVREGQLEKARVLCEIADTHMRAWETLVHRPVPITDEP